MSKGVLKDISNGSSIEGLIGCELNLSFERGEVMCKFEGDSFQLGIVEFAYPNNHLEKRVVKNISISEISGVDVTSISVSSVFDGFYNISFETSSGKFVIDLCFSQMEGSHDVGIVITSSVSGLIEYPVSVESFEIGYRDTNSMQFESVGITTISRLFTRAEECFSSSKWVLDTFI